MLEALSDPDVLEEAEDTRHPDREADGPYFAVVFGQNLDFALA